MRGWIPFLVLGFLLGAFRVPVSAQNAPNIFLARAEACSRTIERLPPSKKADPVHWDRCIRKFKIARDKADAATAPQATYGLAEAYLSRYERKKDPEDLKAALRTYYHLLNLSPDVSLANLAKIRIDTLQGYSKPSTVSCKRGQTECKSVSSSSRLKSVRYWTYRDHTRVVFDLDRMPPYRQRVSNADAATELLFEFINTTPTRNAPRRLEIRNGMIQTIRLEEHDGTTRVLIALSGPLAPKAFSLSNPDRLVVDLFQKGGQHATDAQGSHDTETPIIRSALASLPKYNVRTIVIDPGHGGKDPGAIGPRGLNEKKVVLDIGLRLKKLIEKRLSKKVVMTRTDDTFISLEGRTEMANRERADLFISIHANASPKRSSRGIEIYLLGQATDAQAMETAARENSTSTAAATDFEKLILNDLANDFKLNESLEFAHTVHGAITEHVIPFYPTPDLGVKRAPFFVLAHSRMPAILAELSFVSNPVEEKRLKKANYRQRLAEALFTGVERYIASLEPSF